ncbi:P-loop containing nucleoside triphosphate hydrolase protein, partial [Roridomyces roridus]
MPPNTVAKGGVPGAQAPVKASPSSGSDWIGGFLRLAKIVEAAGDLAPFPYIKGACGVVVNLLEIVQDLKHNREDLQGLCEDIIEILRIIQEEMKSHGDQRADEFWGLCEDFERHVREILESVEALGKKPQGLGGHIRELVQVNSAKEKITGHQGKIQKLRLNFLLRINIRMASQLSALNNVDAPQCFAKFNDCPPPSRIFQGRRTILQQMEAFFNDGTPKQHIFLLHGLGGSGKTQIALKFIEDSASKFSDVFMLDMSSQTTIETGLKNIAMIKNIGDKSDDALKWLRAVQSNWFLLFDNADDPNINLNLYLPRCNQGNILITSRNREHWIYAGANCRVADMEEMDAAELLLKGAAKHVTDENMETAREITKALYCLPLAIAQASAFVAKSRNLKGYLELYKQNQARLLSENPVQQRDGYAWSVYTSWRMSFDRLSHTGQTLLQLCSCLHYQGITEMIFRNAAKYNRDGRLYGPSREQLQGACSFIANFRNQAGQWDSLAFHQVVNEIQAYSLMSVDEETASLSVHPLVHEWCQQFSVTEGEIMINLMGMSISEGNYSAAQSIGMLPHLWALIEDEVGRAPQWNEQFAQIYFQSFRFQVATVFWHQVWREKQDRHGENHPLTLQSMEELGNSYQGLGKFREALPRQTLVLEKRKQLLGDEHPETLRAMGNLSITHRDLGQFNDALSLQTLVLEKQKQLLGDEHPETLWAMGNLALTHQYLGQFNDALPLQTLVLEKQKQLLGDEHPETLRAMGNLAITHRDLGQFNDALSLQTLVLEKQKQLLGEQHPETLRAMGNLALTHRDLGQFND